MFTDDKLKSNRISPLFTYINMNPKTFETNKVFISEGQYWRMQEWDKG